MATTGPVSSQGDHRASVLVMGQPEPGYPGILAMDN